MRMCGSVLSLTIELYLFSNTSDFTPMFIPDPSKSSTLLVSISYLKEDLEFLGKKSSCRLETR